jgi:Ribbon-helix-helix protein, copG family.
MTNGFRGAASTAAGAWGPPGNRRGPRRGRETPQGKCWGRAMPYRCGGRFKISVDVSEEEFKMLEEIKRRLGASSISETVRMLIKKQYSELT